MLFSFQEIISNFIIYFISYILAYWFYFFKFYLIPIYEFRIRNENSIIEQFSSLLFWLVFVYRSQNFFRKAEEFWINYNVGITSNSYWSRKYVNISTRQNQEKKLTW